MSRRDLALALAAAAAQGVAFAVVARLLQRRAPQSAALPELLDARIGRVEQRLEAIEQRATAPAPKVAESLVPARESFASLPPPETLAAADPGGIETPFPRPRGAESYLEEGTVYFAVGQFERAEERFSRALQTEPLLGSAYYNRGLALARMGRIGEALADYDRAATLLPDDPDVFNNRGLMRCARGEFAAALADFRRALALAPEDGLIRLNLGLTLIETGDAGAALVEFERARASDAAESSARYGAAIALAALGRVGGAAGELAAALVADPALAESARTEPRLAPVRGDARVQTLLDGGPAGAAHARALD